MSFPLRFLGDFPAEGLGQPKHRLLEVAVVGDSVPAPAIPFGEQLLDVADGFGGQFGAAGTIVGVIRNGLALVEQDLLPFRRELDCRGQVAQRQTERNEALAGPRNA